MAPLSEPVRIPDDASDDTVIRWGPVSVLTARPLGTRILVVNAERGVTPTTFRRSEPRC